jgi:CBS domain-containing protein
LYKQQFLKLLNYRLLWADHSDYQSGHYLPIHRLSKEQKEELKRIIKHGEALFKSAKKLVEKDDIFGQK